MPVKNVAVSAIGLGKGKGQEVDVGDSSEEEDEEAEVEQTVGTPFQAEATPFGETKEQATKRRARNGEGARAQSLLYFLGGVGVQLRALKRLSGIRQLS